MTSPMRPRLRPEQAPLSLALQGGGAHGAFTWGVLDALLERDGRPIRAVSGTSAGAVNAVALADGLLRGGRDGAREALARVWHAVAAQAPFDWLGGGSAAADGGFVASPAARALLQWTQAWAPAQLNPLDINPLREVLQREIDFERLRASSPLQLFIAATQAASGRLRLFHTRELTAEAVLASACLPTLHRAVEIEGEAYWDGAYAANPALFPLVAANRPADLLIVLLSPLRRDEPLRSAEDIRQRAADIAFNATFLREARLLGEAQALARRSGAFAGPLERRLRAMRFHLLAADGLAGLAHESKLVAHLPFLERLRDLGREQAVGWLQRHGRALGRRGSVDLARVFGADLPPPPGP